MIHKVRRHRPLIMGRNGAVGANNPIAAQAGLDVLRAGGSAADAAVAVSFMLGVCEPGMSGLGGDGFYHAFDGKTGRSVVYNGTGAAPASAEASRFAGAIPLHGPRSVSVPGTLAGVTALHAAHGRLAWKGLVQPAAAAARGGFPVTHTYKTYAEATERARAALSEDRRSAATFLGHEVGDLVVQPLLADTIDTIAEEGGESFYRGRLARKLTGAFAEAGIDITQADLEACRAEITDSISVSYRGYEIRQTPPNSTGFTMLQMLRIAERFDIRGLSQAASIHLLVEAKKLAFQDRDRYGADPRAQPIPLAMLLSDEHARHLAGRIDMERSADLPIASEQASGDTTYFCVVDADGNAVGGIQSNASSFGSGVTAGQTGILMNNRLAYFSLTPGHANALEPGKRVRHTMNCPIVLKGGSLWAVLGTPGSDNQVQVNTQLLTSMVDFGFDPQEAVEAPRWASSQIGQGNVPEPTDGRLTVEGDAGTDILETLGKWGHALNVIPPLSGPCAAQIIRVLDNGVRMAGSDPRRDGWACAY